MQFDRSQIREGMTVYSSDGEKLGKVQSCDASMFVIEKGFFFPKDYVARYDDVRTVDGDEIRLSMSKDTFQELREGARGDEGWRAGSTSTQGAPPTTDADAMAADYGVGNSFSPTGARAGEWRGGSSGASGSTGGWVAGSGEGGVLQPGMEAADDLSRSARAQATNEDRKERVDIKGDDETKRHMTRDEDLSTTRRFGEEEDLSTTQRRSDEDTSGTRGSMNDPFTGIPRDDT